MDVMKVEGALHGSCVSQQGAGGGIYAESSFCEDQRYCLNFAK